jgi:hypothetical protein
LARRAVTLGKYSGLTRKLLTGSQHGRKFEEKLRQ